MTWLRLKLLNWLFPDLEARLIDIERHFVTRRDAKGMVTETLADVPVAERIRRRTGMRGMSVQQRLRWLEVTDGGQNIPGAQPKVASGQEVGQKVNG